MEHFRMCKVILLIIISILHANKGLAQKKYTISFELAPYNYSLGKKGYSENGLGYYDIVNHQFTQHSLAVNLCRRTNSNINLKFGLFIENQRRRIGFEVIEPGNESVLLYSNSYKQQATTIGLNIGIDYVGIDEWIISSGFSIAEVFDQAHNYPIRVGPPQFFFDLQTNRSGVVQIIEQGSDAGSIENYTILYSSLIRRVGDKFGIGLLFRYKPWGQSPYFRLNVRGNTASMTEEGTFDLNDSRILNRFWSVGLLARYDFYFHSKTCFLF